MTEKELRRLRRSDLIEILLELSKENLELREQLQEAQKKLQERQIVIEESGSLAEATLKLNRIFEDAQAGAEGLEPSARGFGVNPRFKEPRAVNRAVEPFLNFKA